MATTTTDNYHMIKPGIDDAYDIGVSNGNLDVIDQVLAEVGSVAGAALPKSSYTAADVLEKLKTVDGAGSGLDADLLQGIDGSQFLRNGGIGNTVMGDDLNNWTMQGIWNTNGTFVANGPYGNFHWGTVVGLTGVNTDTGMQLAVSNGIDGAPMYMRARNGFGWGAWRQIPEVETGTWTPVFTNGSTPISGISYSLQKGNYIRMGSLVFASCEIGCAVSAALTGEVIITGLPFAVGVHHVGVTIGRQIGFGGLMTALSSGTNIFLLAEDTWKVWSSVSAGTASLEASFLYRIS